MPTNEEWHYRPALKDNVLGDAPMTVKVNWSLDDDDSGKGAETDKKDQNTGANKK